ncbi:hypothetical protein BDV93DRAFT_512644 [Ceratobasidium sp. AG-I]|nr:hypothetical protein BDV93DRAFT_512644 [Ceratobasidium sp. AG-I]
MLFETPTDAAHEANKESLENLLNNVTVFVGRLTSDLNFWRSLSGWHQAIFMATLSVAMLSYTNDVASQAENASNPYIRTSWVWSIWFNVLSILLRVILEGMTGPTRRIRRFLSDNRISIIQGALVTNSHRMMMLGLASLLLGLSAFAFQQQCLGPLVIMLFLTVAVMVISLVPTMAANISYFLKNIRGSRKQTRSATLPETTQDTRDTQENV